MKTIVVKPHSRYKAKHCLEFAAPSGKKLMVPQKFIRKLEKFKNLVITNMKAVDFATEVIVSHGLEFHKGKPRTKTVKYFSNGFVDIEYQIPFTKTKGVMTLNAISDLLKK